LELPKRPCSWQQFVLGDFHQDQVLPYFETGGGNIMIQAHSGVSIAACQHELSVDPEPKRCVATDPDLGGLRHTARELRYRIRDDFRIFANAFIQIDDAVVILGYVGPPVYFARLALVSRFQVDPLFRRIARAC
jgi:hypothetical protein